MRYFGGSLGFSSRILQAFLFDTHKRYLILLRKALFSLNLAGFIFTDFFCSFLWHWDDMVILNWGAMRKNLSYKLLDYVFTSGIGIGIVFLGVAELLSHFLSPIGEYGSNSIIFSIFSLEYQCLGYFMGT